MPPHSTYTIWADGGPEQGRPFGVRLSRRRHVGFGLVVKRAGLIVCTLPGGHETQLL